MSHGCIPASYWEQSKRPWVSLIFISPWLVSYELGVSWLADTAVRNGAEAWLRHACNAMGLGHYAWLPLLVIALLLGWHYVRRDSWSIDITCLATMTVESIGWAIGLVILALLLEPLWRIERISLGGANNTQFLQRFVTYCGAGLYEEFLFRLLMVPAAAFLLGTLGMQQPGRIIVAVVLTSLVFAVVHYQATLPMDNLKLYFLFGEPFSWNTFVFRWVAGMLFAALFALRGFGITVAAHAFYDIIVAIL